MGVKGYAPSSLEGLDQMLSNPSENRIVLGGGTDIIISMREEDLNVDEILYLGRIPELKAINDLGDYIEVGAAVTISEIVESDLVQTFYQALYQAAKDMGSVQIRNKGTLVGNLCSASPAGDFLPVLFLYGVEVVLYGPRSVVKVVPIDDFILGKQKINRNNDEIVTNIRLPKSIEKNYRSAFCKLGSRSKVTISRISLAISATFDEGQRVLDSKVYVGAVSPIPRRVVSAERVLKGQRIDQNVVLQIGEILFQSIYDTTPQGYERHDSKYYDRHYRYYKPHSVRGVVEDVVNLLLS